MPTLKSTLLSGLAVSLLLPTLTFAKHLPIDDDYINKYQNRIEKLQENLAMSPEQTALFDAYRTSSEALLIAHKQAYLEHRQEWDHAVQPSSALERMERKVAKSEDMLVFLESTLELQKDKLVNFRSFYNSLDDDQKVMVDNVSEKKHKKMLRKMKKHRDAAHR